MIQKSKLLKYLAKKLARTDECGVKGCNDTRDIELVELQPLDPIDHDSTFVALCMDHQLWARQRNEFAEDMAESLREKRKALGQTHIDKIRELAQPQDGKLREDIAMGRPEESQIPLEDAFEEQPPELSRDDTMVGGLLTGRDEHGVTGPYTQGDSG